MEFFSSTELTIPLSQIALLLIFSTGALLFGKVKLALLINYLFTMYWGYIFNRGTILGDQIKGLDHFTFLYFGFGLVIVILAAVGFFVRSE